jgi:uncharacterized protein
VATVAGGFECEKNLMVPLADGTRLSADLYRPAGASPGPVLVSYYPYRKDDIIGSLFERTRIRLCERGYASVFADMAGTGASGGDYGESFDLPREGRDCAEIIEWVAGQDWCDGNVGAWGVSYGGMTALAAAAHRPPHLRAIAAAYATTDVYRDTIAPEGWPSMLGRYAWAAHMAALGLCPPTLQDPGGRWRNVWDQRLQRLGAGQPHALNWQAHPQRDAYWQERVVDASAISVPALLVGGWADAYAGAMVRVFGEVRGPKRLILGPWMHVLPHLSAVEPWDWVAEMADWWDAHLRPAGSPPERDQVLFFARGGGWRTARQWPPEDVSHLQLYLDGYRLDAAASSEPGRRSYAGDPVAGLAAGIWDPFGTGNGWPEEQSGDDARSLTFTSDPLPDPLLIAGSPEAELHVQLPPGEEAHLAARLCMVQPDGRSELITSGWCRIPPPPGSADAPMRQIMIPLGPAACVLPAGSRVRLSLACANFPHLWPAPVTLGLAVGSGQDSPSVLRLPVSREDGRAGAVAVARPPAEPDTGWVTDAEPVYRLSLDKAAGEAAVTFGARSRLQAPAGAQLSLDEEFTARIRASRPDGAALLARVSVRLRMPAGERVEVSVTSASYRQSSVIEASVTLDGALLLHQRWAGPGPSSASAASS